MESKELKSNIDYTLLQTTVEGQEVVAFPSTTASVVGDSSWYPGNRRPVSTATGPPPNSILLPTAGNALQAVDRSILENVNYEKLVAVSVPDNNVQPGNTLLVVTPTGRTIEAQVPQGVFAGHTFLVQVPPSDAHVVAVPGAAAHQVVVTAEGNTQVVPGHEVLVQDTDLHLHVVTPDVEMTTVQDTQQHQQQTQETHDVADDAKNNSVS